MVQIMVHKVAILRGQYMKEYTDNCSNNGVRKWVKTMVLACLARARARRSPAKRSTFSSVIEDSLLERKKPSRIGPRNFPVFSAFLTKMDQKMTVFELIPLQWGECVQDHPREEESREVGERTGIG